MSSLPSPTIDVKAENTTINVLKGLPTWIPFIITVGGLLIGAGTAYGSLKSDITEAKNNPDVILLLTKMQSDVETLKKQREEGYSERIELQKTVDAQGRVLARIAGKLGVSE